MRSPRWVGAVGRRYLVAAGAVLAAGLILFLLAEVWDPSILSDPSPRLRRAGPPAAALGVGLLTVDAVLPVPASLVMIAHGAAFGVPIGTLLSIAGSTGCTLVGFAIGRRGGPLLSRWVPPEERAAADRALARWGIVAIVASRPVPLIAETVAVLAGASPMGWGRATLAAIIGAAPPALLYALAGAAAISFRSGAVVFAAAIVVSGSAWFVGKRLERRLTPLSETARSPEGCPAEVQGNP